MSFPLTALTKGKSISIGRKLTVDTGDISDIENSILKQNLTPFSLPAFHLPSESKARSMTF